MNIPDKTVTLIVEHYRDEAEDYARRMAWRCTKSGDHGSAAYWREMMQAIVNKEHKKKAA